MFTLKTANSRIVFTPRKRDEAMKKLPYDVNVDIS